MAHCRHLAPGCREGFFTSGIFKNYLFLGEDTDQYICNCFTNALVICVCSERKLHLVSSHLGELLELEFQNVHSSLEVL